MQMNEQILTALEVLRNFAENDFERHRIDVLEQDLTAPPKVEIIDDKHQIFNGTKYLLGKSQHFVTSSALLHRAVYSYYCGEIPEGYVIHHKDFNPANNDISNLQMLTKKQHNLIHNSIVNKKCTCEYCGKNFYSTVGFNQRFCSHLCREKWRYHFGKKLYKKTCPICGKEFETSIERVKYCSPKCSNDSRKKTIKPRVCPICGKTFTPITNRIIYCSHSCARKSRDLNKSTSKTAKKD